MTALIVLIAIAVIALVTRSYAEGAFYYPTREVYDTPDTHGIKYEEVTFQSLDGTKLSGWFLYASTVADPRQAKGTVIHFHGNAQNMTAHSELVGWLTDRGYNVFLFDYRGYGKSEGKPRRKGVWEDSRAAIRYVRSRTDIDTTKLFIFGQSLGGTNAIAAVSAEPKGGLCAVAIEATFYSYSSIANDKVPGVGILLGNKYGAARNVAALAPIPLLFIHGTADQVIPVKHSEKLYAAALEPKELVIIPGGTHIDAMTPQHGDKYRNLLVEFFEKALPASSESDKTN